MLVKKINGGWGGELFGEKRNMLKQLSKLYVFLCVFVSEPLTDSNVKGPLKCACRVLVVSQTGGGSGYKLSFFCFYL